MANAAEKSADRKVRQSNYNPAEYVTIKVHNELNMPTDGGIGQVFEKMSENSANAAGERAFYVRVLTAESGKVQYSFETPASFALKVGSVKTPEQLAASAIATLTAQAVKLGTTVEALIASAQAA